MCRCWFLHSIGTKASSLSLFCIPSGWGHPLGQVVFPFPLDLDRRIPLDFGFCSFRWGLGSDAFACHLFPWVGFIIYLCAPLLFSVWLPYALWISFSWHLSLPRLVGLFDTVSSFDFHWFLSLAASSVSLFLLFSTWWFWVVLRSLVGLLCSFGRAPFPFLARKFLSPVSSFQLLVFRVFRWSSKGFFFRAPLLSFLPLGSSCFVGVHCVPCSSLLSLLLVTLSFSVFNILSFFYTGFRFSFLVHPLVSPWFHSFSSPASSSSSVL